MKHAGFILLTVLFFAFSGCITSNTSPNITAGTVSEKPTIFCTVLNEPDPMLIGGWQCRTIPDSSRSKGVSPIAFNDPVEYWLVKNGNRYALYYYFKSPNSSNIGWKPFIVNGNEIRFSRDGKTPSSGYRKFMTKNGKVYFVPPNGEKNEMTRIPEKQMAMN